MVLAEIFGPEILIVIILQIAFPIWALIDIASRPAEAWDRSGQNRALWLVLNVLGIFVCGLVIGLVYLIAIRPKVAGAADTSGKGRSITLPPKVNASIQTGSERCPICGTPFADYGTNIEHGRTHVISGPAGYRWECSCGEHDCCWEHDGEASLALLTHISDRHNMMLDFGYGKERMRYPR